MSKKESGHLGTVLFYVFRSESVNFFIKSSGRGRTGMGDSTLPSAL